jgi:serine/threonine protein kinase
MNSNKWYKFLIKEGSRNFLDQNIRYIGFISNDKFNSTLLNLSKFYSQEEFKDALEDSGTSKILNDYEIDELLGKGAMGLAFKLKDPHENYVLKFQILDEDSINNIGEVGTEYTSHLHKKQEQDEYDPKELRVLDSEKGFITLRSGEKIFISAAVMAKAAETGISGKTGNPMTTDNVMYDISGTKIQYVIKDIIEYYKSDDRYRKYVLEKIKNKTRASRYVLERIEHLLNIKDTKNIFRILYMVFNNRNGIAYLSEEQFIGISLQLFKILKESYDIKGYNTTLDLHSGNFGFRPNSDIPIFFDI